jgi:spectrin beta
VTQLRQEHDGLRFEMSQRDDAFRELDAMCAELARQKHPHRVEVVAQTNQAMTAREGLFRLWKTKSDLLESQCEVQGFYREVGVLVALLGGLESGMLKAYNEAGTLAEEGVLIGEAALGEAVKAHEAVTQRVDRQAAEKTEELVRLGEELLVKEKERSMRVEQAEFKINETYGLQQRLALVRKKQDDVRHVCAKRSRQLADLSRFSELRRDMDEFEAWLAEKTRLVRAVGADRLSERVKLFQRQKALGIEVEANAGRYAELARRCDEQLRVNRTVGRALMQEAGEEMARQWKLLCDEVARRAAEFEEARDVLEFSDQLGQLEEWLTEKELMVASGDTGRDFEHCSALMRRADEAAGGGDRLARVVEMGERLERLGRTDQYASRKDRLLERYARVEERVRGYRERLGSALQVHGFNRDYEEMQARLAEKRALLVSEMDLRTLDSVQAAQVKASGLESDLKAIRARLDALDNETFQFISQAAEEDGQEVVTALRAKMTETGVQVRWG